MSAVSPNLRPACGGTSALPTLGGCYQNADAVDSTTKIKYNVTEMFHYTASQPTYIPPYELANLTTEACSPYSTTSYPIFVCGNFTNGNLYCYPIPTSYMHGSGSGTASFQVGDYLNFYSQSNDTASNPCGDNRALGFKNCYAKKTWSGRKSFTSPDHGKPDDWDWCPGGCYSLNARAIDTTKYLTLTANSVYEWTEEILGSPEDIPNKYYNCDDPPVEVDGNCRTYPDRYFETYTGTANATSTVDKYGQITVASCHSASSGNFSGICSGDPGCIQAQQEAFANLALALLGMANDNWTILITAWMAKMSGGGSFSDIAGCAPDVVTHVGAGSWHAEWHSGNNPQPTGGTCTSTLLDEEVDGTYGWCDPRPTEKKLYYEMDITPTRLEIKQYGQKITVPECDGGDTTFEWMVVDDYILTFGPTGFTMESTAYENTFSINWQRLIHQELTAALSNPYTAAEVYQDLVDNLLSQWDMGEDMPWRTDTRKTIGPMVSRKETTNYPYIGNCNLTTSQWTGEIRGAPAPVGIDKVWDVSHPNYCTCPDQYLPENISFYLRDYGAWSTDAVYGCGVPRATQWTNFWEANNFPDGAFIGSNIIWTFPASAYGPSPAIIADDQLYACKYAESIFSKQSFNYARPCGADFLQLSSSTARCIESVAGDVLTLEPTSPTNVIASGSKVWVCGGLASTLEGLWTVQSSAAHSITLHEPRIASASQFPTVPIANGGTGVVVQLLWPNLRDKICGRVGIDTIASSSAGGAVTASLDTPTYLITGDSVAVTGVTSPSLNGTHTVTVVDNATIILDGTSGGSAYVGQGQIYSPLGADWKWNDVSTKGDFSYKTWLSEYRSLGEYNRIVDRNTIQSDPLTSNCNGSSPCGFLATVPAVVRPKNLACNIDQNWITMNCGDACLPVGVCGAAAAYFSPNSESFVGPSKTLGWSSPISIDSLYGGFYWQGIVKQSMDDLYFNPGPCRCEYQKDCSDVVTHECISTWEEDGGYCTPDVEPVLDCDVPELSVQGRRYYANRNQYEARCTLPTINGEVAPALLGGVTLGCLTTAQANAGNCNGNYCSAPYAPNTFPADYGSGTCNPYLVYVVSDPWVLLVIKESCVCNVGRFATQYAANGITGGPTCPPIVPPP